MGRDFRGSGRFTKTVTNVTKNGESKVSHLSVNDRNTECSLGKTQKKKKPLYLGQKGTSIKEGQTTEVSGVD